MILQFWFQDAYWSRFACVSDRGCAITLVATWQSPLTLLVPVTLRWLHLGAESSSTRPVSSDKFQHLLCQAQDYVYTHNMRLYHIYIHINMCTDTHIYIYIYIKQIICKYTYSYNLIVISKSRYNRLHRLGWHFGMGVPSFWVSVLTFSKQLLLQPLLLHSCYTAPWLLVI